MLALLRIIIHLGCFAPLMWLLFVLFSGNETALGADPVKEIEHFLGYTAILIFCAMFLLGILLQILKKNQYQILRRPLGLWAFVWASLHIMSYLFLELGLDFSLFINELLTRPYLILGSIAFSILSVMAVTSLPQIKTWLGKRWFQIHQFAYVAIACAAIHYYWSSKSLTLSPILVGVVVIGIIIRKYIRKYALNFLGTIVDKL